MTEQEKIKKYREIVQRRIRAQIEVADEIEMEFIALKVTTGRMILRVIQEQEKQLGVIREQEKQKEIDLEKIKNDLEELLMIKSNEKVEDGSSEAFCGGLSSGYEDAACIVEEYFDDEIKKRKRRI